MSAPILYPTINGVRHSWASVEFKIAGQIIYGCKTINYSRKRNRTQARGFSPDPIGKTRGFNEYTADVEMYLAEFNYLQGVLQSQAALQQQATNGNGYGDVFFQVTVMYTENGFDQITDTLNGCTMDSTEVGMSQSAEALVRKFELSPLKIIFNGQDDLVVPLTAPPGT
jgi:hypothetical protein